MRAELAKTYFCKYRPHSLLSLSACCTRTDSTDSLPFYCSTVPPSLCLLRLASIPVEVLRQHNTLVQESITASSSCGLAETLWPYLRQFRGDAPVTTPTNLSGSGRGETRTSHFRVAGWRAGLVSLHLCGRGSLFVHRQLLVHVHDIVLGFGIEFLLRASKWLCTQQTMCAYHTSDSATHVHASHAIRLRACVHLRGSLKQLVVF